MQPLIEKKGSSEKSIGLSGVLDIQASGEEGKETEKNR